MRDLTASLLALALTAPVACTHDDRDAETPTRPAPASAGGDVGPPAPPGTSEPTVPGVPNASQGLLDNTTPNQAATFGDSRTAIKPGAVAQVDAATGGSVGTGGTIGSGGTFGSGGLGGGSGGVGSGGSPIGR
jgi:hypothetical protein